MKKLKYIFISIFALCLGSVLSACTFKQVEANFSKEEIVISSTENIELEKILTVKGTSLQDIEFKFSTSSIFSIDKLTVSPLTSGQTYIYAMHNNNVLDSMKLVCKKAYSSPKNIEMDDNGLLTWDKVLDKFDDSSNVVTPSNYQLNISYYNPENEKSHVWTESVNTNSFQLTDSGRYEIAVSAKAEGYFEDSKARIVTCYFGYMPKLTLNEDQSDFTWNNETQTLSWSQISNAKYSVTFDNEIIANNLEEENIDLSAYLNDTNEHSVVVTVHDKNEEKISMASDVVTVCKLDIPTYEEAFNSNEGGKIWFNNATSYKVLLTNQKSDVFTYEFEGQVTTEFNGLAGGMYTLTLQSLASPLLTNGKFYANSNAVNVCSILKLDAVAISGAGENVDNGNLFNIELTRENTEVGTSILISADASEYLDNDGFEQNSDTIAKEVTIENAGTYIIKAKQIAKSANLGENCIIINSDYSQPFEVVKLPAFEQSISHSYKDGVSELSFQPIEDADNYTLLINQSGIFENVDLSLYSLDDTDETLFKFVFVDKIENLFGDATFKIVANIGDNTSCIPSSDTLSLTQLATPNSTDGNTTNTLYSWDSVEGAESYNVKTYVITKELFDAETVDSIDVSLLIADEQTVYGNSINLTGGQYYYMEIFATPANEDANLTSQTFKAMFYISKKLNSPQITFGENEHYKNDLTSATGYFVRITSVENAESFVGKLNNEEMTYTSQGEGYVDYLFTSDFVSTTGDKISVMAQAEDSRVFLDSEESSLTIKKLATINSTDFNIDKLTQTLTIAGNREGVSQIYIYERDNTDNFTLTNNTDAKHSIKNIFNTYLNFQLYGTEKQSGLAGEKLYQSTDGKVYLDSNVSSYQFKRLANPTNFTYYNGNLTFNYSSSQYEYFVLDITTTDANNNQSLIKVNFGSDNDDKITMDCNGISYSTGLSSSLFLSGTDNSYSILFSQLLSLVIAGNETLNTVYQQAVDITFGLYAYKNTLESGAYLLSSNYATLLSDSTKENLVVEKMQAVNLSYDKATNTISWVNAVTNLGETKYQVSRRYIQNGGEVSETLISSTANAYVVDLSTLADSLEYSFAVTASNPYYLESSYSNNIYIYKLSSISSVKLADNKLQYSVKSEDTSLVDKIKVQINDNEPIVYDNLGQVTITTFGTYKLTLVGTESLGNKYVYNSVEASVVVSDFSTLEPSDSTVSFANNVVSWNEFGSNLQTLKYIVVFADGNNYAQFNTTELSLILTDSEDILSQLSKLTNGNLSIDVYAVIETYNVSAGGTIYCNTTPTTLTSGEVLYNTYSYTSNSSVTKLATPKIESIEFTDDIEQAQITDIKVAFSGNFTDDETFNVYLGNRLIKEDLSLTAENGLFTFQINYDEYNNESIMPSDATTRLSIYAKSEVNLPSSGGFADIYRNGAFGNNNVALESDENGYAQKIILKFTEENIDYATGGVVVGIYNPSENKYIYRLAPADVYNDDFTVEYDISSILQSYLYDGGLTRIMVYVNNYSYENLHYLASITAGQTAELQVLKAVEESDIQLLSNGIKISNLINSQNTVYYISYANEVYEISSENDFFFEYPTAWTSGDYTLCIVAKEAGKINSCLNNITITLNRLDKVNNVKIKRSETDLSVNQLSWDAVAQAESYLIRVYTEDALIAELETVSTNCTLYDIFGNNYSNIGGYLFTDIAIRFEIYAMGDGTNSMTSNAFAFNATLLGNGMIIQRDIYIDEYGILSVNCEENSKYLYRTSSSVNGLSAWKEISSLNGQTVLKIDLKGIEGSIKLQILRMGDNNTYETSVSSSYLMAFDSYYVESLIYQKVGKATGVAEDDNPVLSVITLDSELSENDKIYVSLDSTFSSTNLFELSVTSAGQALDGTRYTFNPTSIIDNFNLNSDTTLYFYIYKQSSNSDVDRYITSDALEYQLLMDNSSSVLSVEKVVGTLEEGGNIYNSYLTFTNDANIFAFYLKITYTSEASNPIEKFAIVYVSECENLFDGKIAINITDVLSGTDIDGNSLDFGAGDYKVAVLVVKLIDEKTYYSQWYFEADGKGLEFVKIDMPTDVKLYQGNLIWDVSQDVSDKLGESGRFYIYFESIYGSEYNVYESTTKAFDATSVAEESAKYYIGVSCVSEDPFVISSNRRYVTSGTEKTEVLRNQFVSALKNSEGSLTIDWASNSALYTYMEDFAQLINMDVEANGATMANALINNTFVSPFTFNLYDIVNGNVVIRIRFVGYDADGNVNYRRSVDVNAIYLLGNVEQMGLTLSELQDKLKMLEGYVTSSTNKELISKFSAQIKNFSGGVGNYINLFDDIFESIQSGKYSIEYCLLGNDSTLNSRWMTVQVENSADNFVYVNSTPTVSAFSLSDEDDKTINTYYLKIRKSQIYTENGALTEANKYYLKLIETGSTGNYQAFEIFNVEGNWSCKLLGQETGFDVMDDGEYLTIYLNMNNGQSLLGCYNDLIEKGNYYFEIFAVGNDYSLSSKSNRFNIVFYSACSNFKLENGMLSWVAYQNRPTTVVFKALSSTSESEPISVQALVESVANFSLEGQNAGEYEYIKFVTLGGIVGNTISIDSEIYTISNLYKLARPTLTTSLNQITINDSANLNRYSNSYTSNATKFNYMVSNNMSEDLRFVFGEENVANVNSYHKTIYNTGISNYSSQDSDYMYKLSETTATQFNISSLGSSAQFTTSVDIDNYYIVNFAIDGGSGYLCLRSDNNTIDAKMLNKVENLAVQDGVVTWANDNVVIDGYELSENVDIVYKVVIREYETTNSAYGSTKSYFGDAVESYTTEKLFDLSTVEEFLNQQALNNNKEEYQLEVSIYALALNVSEQIPTTSYKTTINGKYIYGDNLTYLDSTIKILMSDCETIDNIEYSAIVENLQVMNGRLQWTYEKENSNFSVEDEQGNVIDGSFERALDDETCVVFTESLNSLSAGKHNLKVYAIYTGTGLYIKSKAQLINVYKIPKIEEDDYIISMVESETLTYEVMDFSNYFENNNSLSNLEINVVIGTKEIVLTKENSKVYIFNSETDAEEQMNVLNISLKNTSGVETDFYDYFVNIKNGESVTATYEVSCGDVYLIDDNTNEYYYLYSDIVSEEISRPQNLYNISWNDSAQIFSWEWNGTNEPENVIYVVTATYTYTLEDGTEETVIRVYETTEKSFCPTIIGNVSIAVALKNGRNAIQSTKVTYGDEVSFNLFESGDGSSISPYIISNSQQFSNIQYRMSKEEYLTNFIENQETQTEINYYNFRIEPNLQIALESEFGIIFGGQFNGVIYGNGATITYTTHSVSKLQNDKTVSDGAVSSTTTGESTVYQYGASLFEELGNNCSIENLNINANFTSAETAFTSDILVAGLAIVNNGTVSSVKLTGFSSDLQVNRSGALLISAYGGIVALNSGRILSCNISMNDTIEISDQGNAQCVFFGGVAFTNYATIQACNMSTSVNINITHSKDTAHQLGGIVVTSTSTGSLISNELSDGEILVIKNENKNTNVAYVGGIAVFAQGSVQDNVYYSGCVQANTINTHYTSDNVVITRSLS